MKAVILAGGKGTRLKPYTTHFPKPLMPVGDKPILETVISYLKSYDIVDIIITTGHQSNLIQSFFDDGKKFGVNISYSMESKPMGTAGPLDIIREQINDTFILINGDILTDIDISNLLKFHSEQKAMATVALKKRTVYIDFGVVEVTKGKKFHKWKEKPNLDFFVSTGLYVLEPSTLKYVPKSTFFNLPDLIVAVHEGGGIVSTFLHDGFWLDIGRPDDYERACQLFEKGE
jgi:NDP-sugar pyrophosphorylase family protein